jgi:hypothetical protein
MRSGTPLVVEHLEGISRAVIGHFPELVTEFTRGKAKSIDPIDHSPGTSMQAPRLAILTRLKNARTLAEVF